MFQFSIRFGRLSAAHSVVAKRTARTRLHSVRQQSATVTGGSTCLNHSSHLSRLNHLRSFASMIRLPAELYLTPFARSPNSCSTNGPLTETKCLENFQAFHPTTFFLFVLSVRKSTFVQVYGRELRVDFRLRTGQTLRTIRRPFAIRAIVKLQEHLYATA